MIRLELEIEVLQKGADLGILKGFGEKWVAKECAEFPLAGKGLEFWVIHDDRPWDRFSGLWIDDGLELQLGLCRDQFGKRQAIRLREGIEVF